MTERIRAVLTVRRLLPGLPPINRDFQSPATRLKGTAICRHVEF
jgi:hypothetical protein